jgi:HNH endonuclease
MNFTIQSKHGSFKVQLDDALRVLARERWYADVNPKRKAVYAARLKAGKKVYLHREVYALAHPDWDGKGQVDHENEDGLDCRAENLRAASHTTNKWNVSLKSTNTSGVKGVWFDEQTRMWRGEVTAGGRRFNVRRDTNRAIVEDRVRALREEHQAGFVNHG